MMISLPNVTLVCIDTVNYGPAINAINKSLEKIKPAKTIFFTDIACVANDDFDVINIKHLYSKKDYSKFMMKELGKHIQTDFMLVVQWDGYVLDENAWDDEFLKYDYIGAPWIYGDGKNVGNGGFSLRSTRLHQILKDDSFILPMSLEDDAICRTYREYLEEEYRIKFAPEELAHKFSFELQSPRQETFGFHSFFHQPFKEHIVIKRTGALGDVIQTEPIMEYFHKQGHPVVLQTTPSFYNVFAMHHYPVISYERFDKSVRHRIVSLEMAYEITPKQLHIRSYFEMAGIKDYVLRNPKLNYKVTKESRLFKQKYVVIHIDNRETPHRNQFGIDWRKVREYLESIGYLVIQIGKNEHDDAGIEFNCFTETMLMWVIAGADLMIAVDSGPSHIAVALDKKCVLLFGSVNPEFIHADMSKIKVLQSSCPIQNDHCWHSQVSTVGVECPVSKKNPPCCVYDTDRLIKLINEQL